MTIMMMLSSVETLKISKQIIKTPDKVFFICYNETMNKEQYEISHPKEFNYDFIIDGIYIGSNQCCSVHLSKLLTNEGIDVNISLEEDRLDQPFGVISYAWIPIIDMDVPTIEQLEYGIKTLEHFVTSGHKIFVHCKNGHGRSSTLVTAYLMQSKDISFEEAFGLIKKGREHAHMNEKQESFVKEYFKDKNK